MILLSDVFLSISGSLTCGLDYSQVNHNIHTFIAFSWLCTKLIPLVLVVFFCIRIFCWNRDKAIYRTYSYVSGVSEDVLRAKVVAYTMFIMLFTVSLHDALHLAIGYGWSVSSFTLFVSSIAMYASWSIMPCFYMCTLYCSCCAKVDCCYYCCCICCCCCCCKPYRNGREWTMSRDSTRTRSRNAYIPRAEPDITTRLLTVSRTYSEASGVVTERESVRLSSHASQGETSL